MKRVALFLALLAASSRAEAEEASERAQHRVAAARILRDRGNVAGAALQIESARGLLAAVDTPGARSIRCVADELERSLRRTVPLAPFCPPPTPGEKSDGRPSASDLEETDRVQVALDHTDPNAAKIVRRVVELARAGRARDSARLAQSILFRLDARAQRALAALPARSLAELRVAQAKEALIAGDPLTAIHRIDEAHALSPKTADDSHVRESAIALRAAQLGKRARAVAADEPALAAGYFMGWRSLVGGDAPLPGALADAIGAVTSSRIVVRDSTERSWATGERFHRVLMSTLTEKLPKSVAIREEGTDGDWELVVGLAMPKREFSGTVELRDKAIVAYSYRKPNPAWEEAANAYNEAIENTRQARAEAQELHRAAVQMAQNANSGGLAGMFAATAATGEETGAAALVISSQHSLRDASNKLRSTPQMIDEQVKANAHYPVQVFSAHATCAFAYRFSGPSVNMEKSGELVQDQKAEVVTPIPEIGVEGRDTGLAALSVVEPNGDGTAAELGTLVATTVRDAEEARLWADVERARASGHADERAVASAAYLVGGTREERRAEVLQYLAWELQ